MTTCALCGWLLDEEHIFNVQCAAANAQNDQLEAEIAEERARVLSPEEQARVEHLVSIGMEIMHDVIAFRNFERLVREQP